MSADRISASLADAILLDEDDQVGLYDFVLKHVKLEAKKLESRK